jgi:hypothetical protein
MDAIENHLISIAKIPENSGHTLHKGTPREIFIREYLEGHISSNIALATEKLLILHQNLVNRETNLTLSFTKRTSQN